MSFRTPRQNATGLGSAGYGTGHWWTQRITSVALIPLTVLFLFPFGSALGDSHAQVMALYASPWHALVAILFIGVTAHHLMAGVQVVIEDYVHAKGWRTGLLLGNIMACVVLGAAGIFSVARIAFSA